MCRQAHRIISDEEPDVLFARSLIHLETSCSFGFLRALSQEATWRFSLVYQSRRRHELEPGELSKLSEPISTHLQFPTVLQR